MQSEMKTVKIKHIFRGSAPSYTVQVKPVLEYKTSGGGTQLGQIEARPFVWVTVKALICMQAYRPRGSIGLTLSYTLIYVLISPYVLFPLSSLTSFFYHLISLFSNTPLFFFVLCFQLVSLLFHPV